MSKDFISVIIITYNMGHLISHALDSLRNQTRKDFEIIVVDNHSTDNTIQVINKYQDLKLSFLQITNNGILSKSRNLGIRNAKGNWIAFLDADDYWSNDKIEKLYQCINKSELNVVAISHGFEIKDIQKNKSFYKTPKIEHDLTRQLILGKNPFALTATTVRTRSLIEAGGFSEYKDYRTVEDYELWIRLSKLGEFKCLDENLATIVLHEGNYSKKADVQMKALDTLKDFYILSFDGCSEFEKKVAYKNLYDLEARCLQKNGFFDEAKQIIGISMSKRLFSLKMCLIYLLCEMKIER